MTELIIVFGILIFLAGLVIMISPELIFGYLRRHVDKPAIHVIAVVFRLVIGALLISQSGVSKYPLVMEVLGWLSIVAALFLAVMGRRNFLRLMSWALSLVKPYGRIGGIFASAFGAFLVYAFI